MVCECDFEKEESTIVFRENPSFPFWDKDSSILSTKGHILIFEKNTIERGNLKGKIYFCLTTGLIFI